MSVLGELTRHLDELLERLSEEPSAPARGLAATLRDARPSASPELSRSAERILDALASAGLAEDDGSDTPGFAPVVHEAARDVVALCRIVLGR